MSKACDYFNMISICVFYVTCVQNNSYYPCEIRKISTMYMRVSLLHYTPVDNHPCLDLQ